MMIEAGRARSILARPGRVAFEVDGVPVDVRELEMTDEGGVPRLTLPIGAEMASRAECAAGAVLRVDTPSGDRDPDGRPVDQTLTVAGVLQLRGVATCKCCEQVKHVVHLRPDFVLVTTWSRIDGRRFVVGRPERIDTTQFRSSEHVLNAGFLRAAAEHATACHQDDLRRALATRTRTSPEDLIAVQLCALTPRSVELVWVDRDGAHRTTLTFPRRVRDRRELAANLRARLEIGAC